MNSIYIRIAIVLLTLLFLHCCKVQKAQNPFSNGGKFKKTLPSDRPSIVIVFSMNDCPLCLFEATYWSLAAKDGLPITGLTDESSPGKVKSFINDYDIKFDIIQSDELFKQALAFLQDSDEQSQTPMKVFLKGNREVFHIEYGVKDIEQHRSFSRRSMDKLENIDL